jgi:hypothetical protein
MMPTEPHGHKAAQSAWAPPAQPKALNADVRAFNVLVGARHTSDEIVLTILALLRAGPGAAGPAKAGMIGLCLNGTVLDARPLRLERYGSGNLRPLLVTARVPYRLLAGAPIHTRIELVYSDGERGFVKAVRYAPFGGDSRVGSVGGKVRARKTIGETTYYIRQSSRNKAYLTQRRRLDSDEPGNNRKLTAAYWLTRLVRWPRYVLLYEKESARYEESASMVFERLVDAGVTNARFILSERSAQYEKVPQRYRSYVLKKGTWAHYLAFFRSKVFVGTEMVAHAVDLRVANLRAASKVREKGVRFVFLQHGVMYFVALSAKARAAARKGTAVMPEDTVTIVSSECEARHFIRHGGYSRQDIWITGLPKFDRARRAPDADRIAVMPTWRPWEYNLVRNDCRKTGYYAMAEAIIEAVPPELRDRVVLMPHPLFSREMRQSPLSRYLPEGLSYDEVLEKTDLLVTDYSSIAADAFYRGAKVVFWWKDLPECMRQYGGTLMMDKRTVFGDVAKRPDLLRHFVRKRYGMPQDPVHVARFNRVVEFRDGHNTERVLECLAQAGIAAPALRAAHAQEGRHEA